MWSNEEADRITSLISKTTRYNISLTLLLVIGLGALAGDFIPLYFGEEFTPATSYLLLLLPGALGFAIARPIFAIGQGKGSLRILVLATGISAVLNILLNLVLIPRYGATGAAVATSISYGSMIVFHIISARKIGFNPLRDARLTRISAVALLSAPVIFGLGRVIDSSIISLIIVPPIGFLVYSILTVKLKVIPMSELMELVEEIPEPF
jgi:O-antigen/teichoic acid export membrane protein